MNILQVAVKELIHRKVSLILGITAVAIASASLIGAITVLNIHDIQTEHILNKADKEAQEIMAILKEEMRKATLKLSFNLLILPQDQNLNDFYANDYASKYMPEEYVNRLASSGTVIVRHFLPSLQQKLEWPEVKRKIILIGTRGEVPNAFKHPKKPIVQSVPQGTIVLGSELHQSLGLKVKDKVKLLGREFIVHRCHEERGNKDDITAWIFLRDAQELLDKQGKINSILALECLCVTKSGKTVRDVIKKVLPDTKVVEMGTNILARQESRLKVGKEARAKVANAKKDRETMRKKRELFMALFIPLIMTSCILWLGYLAFRNVQVRKYEIAAMRAIGVGTRQILGLMMTKALAIGALGGPIGFLVGLALGVRAGNSLGAETGLTPTMKDLFDPSLLGLALIVSVICTILATWIPAILASRKDPAVVLKGE